MSNSFTRMLKLAQTLDASGDSVGLARLCVQFNAYVKKCANYEPVNDGTTPNPFRTNMDYGGWENSPYYGSMSEFMKKFPGGISDWIVWRKDTEKERNLLWSKVSERRHSMQKKVAADTIDSAITKWANVLKRKARANATTYIRESLASAKSAEQFKWQTIHNNIDINLKVLDQFVDYEIKKDNMEAMIRSLFKFKGTPKYSKYKKLFYNMAEHIANTAVGRFYNYLAQMEAPEMAAEDEPFIPSVEETVDSLIPPTDEERIKARELIEKVLKILTKDEAKILLDESSPDKSTIIEAHFVPVGPDDTSKFPDEPHLYSDEGLKKFKSITEYLKKYRGESQDADDLSGAAAKAVKDFINYWKLLQKSKGRRKKRKGRK